MSDNITLGADLRHAHSKLFGKAKERAIRLPADTHIIFTKDADDVRIQMTSEATSQNMQGNSPAFEGWALAIKLWLPHVQKVRLSWTPPAGTGKRHYARFLYRVQRFQDLFRIGSRWRPRSTCKPVPCEREAISTSTSPLVYRKNH